MKRESVFYFPVESPAHDRAVNLASSVHTANTQTTVPASPQVGFILTTDIFLCVSAVCFVILAASTLHVNSGTNGFCNI